MDGTIENKVFAPGYGEFHAHVPVDDELVTVAVAVPTDARRGRVPAELRRLLKGANRIFGARRGGSLGPNREPGGHDRPRLGGLPARRRARTAGHAVA